MPSRAFAWLVATAVVGFVTGVASDALAQKKDPTRDRRTQAEDRSTGVRIRLVNGRDLRTPARACHRDDCIKVSLDDVAALEAGEDDVGLLFGQTPAHPGVALTGMLCPCDSSMPCLQEDSWPDRNPSRADGWSVVKARERAVVIDWLRRNDDRNWFIRWRWTKSDERRADEYISWGFFVSSAALNDPRFGSERTVTCEAARMAR